MTARRTFPVLGLIVLALFAAPLAQAQVSLTTLGTPYTQNFDTLLTTGTANPWTDNSTIPGWYAQFSATPANPTTYRADSGGSNTGAIYSWGQAGVNPLTERAFGMLSSGTPVTVLTAVRFVNNTGAPISSLQISYNGEQWRDGGAATPVAQTTFFEYQVGNAGAITDANAPSTGWTSVSSLDFTSPTFTNTGAGAAIEGNQAANRTAKSATVVVTVNPGQEIWLRWRDPNDGGNDHGLGVDDLSVTPQGAVVLPNLTVTDVSQVETNAGTTTFTFQVNLSAPAGPGGVTFDIATADGTAQDDNPVAEDNDYVPQSLTGQGIAAGNSSFAFNVTVNGDVIPEANETFFVNVTNVTGATVTDGQGQGTIQNDDASCANLSISDVTQNEGNGGTSTFAFTVALSQAGCGTVTFDIATADGTAQDDNPATEDNDYVPQSLTGQTVTFPSTYTFNVTVNGDIAFEPNQTFFVNITNVSPGNVTVTDGQGLGTIVNDDFTRIHDIQGNGGTSPLAGQTVSPRGIVTLLKSNGFFLQEAVADYDADPNTSEGIFVFTSSAPTVAVGDNATVTGTVVEFNGLTEISPVSSIVVNSTGNVLPAAIVLTPTDLPPAGSIAQPQLEKYESMRVTAASLTTVAPNDSFFDVDTVLTSQPRPMREPGIPVSDPIPPDPTTGLPDCCIAIWDENPERLSVDTNGRLGSTGETLTSNVTLTGVTGPLDFSFSRYRLIPDVNLTRTANMSAVAVPLPAANEFTIAGYNIENFNNAATQRQKAALTIRDVLRLPDIIGTVEIFDLADLQALANEIQTISGVTYSAHLVEQDGTSEDSDQDVGFLVKTSRVSVTSVTQEGASETFINPNTGLPETLHDRPPLVLRATVDPSGPSPQPVIVVVNHLRSFIDIELVAGEGVRVREKRKKQAESLADLLNDLQIANPTTPIISLGDYNAFQFSSGYDDSISVIRGTPTPDDQIVVDQSPDLVNPDFFNLLLNVPADQRYSFIFENTPQSLDHVLANTAAQAIYSGIAVARVNSDFPSTPASAFESNAARPEANSDHDPVVAYFVLPGSADVSVTKTDNVDPVNAGQNFFYTVTVDNAGPDPADTVAWSDALPAGTAFVSLSQPGGWTCTTPAVGANGTVSCSIASMPVGSAAFNITVSVNAGLASGTVLSNTATATTTTTDPNGANNSDTETTTVATSADLQISKTDSPDPVNAGSNLSYTITLTNNGPSNAASAVFTDALPAGTTFVSLSTTGSWTCTTPAVGANGTVTCTNSSFLVTADFFTIVVNVDPTVATGTVLSNTATLSATTPDPNGANNSATATTTVATSADLLLSKTDTPDPVNAGSNISYQLTLTNAGPSNATTATFTDVLPAGTTFVSLSTTGPWTCTTPAVGATGTVSCTNPSYGGVDFFTLVVNVNANVAAGTVLSNTATLASATPDPNGANNSDTATTTVGASADLQLTKTDSVDPVTAGNNISYTVTVSNAGPSNAANVTFTDTLPAGTTFSGFLNPAGWSCIQPPPGGTGTITCSIPSLPAGYSDVYIITVTTSPALANGTIISNTASVTSATTNDPSPTNNTATATTTVGTGSADLSIAKSDSGDPVVAGNNIDYAIQVTNAGPSAATTVTMTDTLPVGTTFVSLAAPAGWTCTTPPVGGTGTVSCSIASLGVTAAPFALVVNVDPALATGTVITNTASVSSPTTDPNPSNQSSTATTSVVTSADLTITKVDSPDPVTPGTNLTYTITVTNSGPSNAASVTLADTVPTGTTFVSLASPAGWTCTTPPVGGTGAVSCTLPTMAPGNALFSLTVAVAPGLANGTVISNTATVTSPTDPGGATNTATATTAVGVGSADVSITKTDSPDPVNAGADITYTITVNNAGPTNAASAAMNDTLPGNTTFVSLITPAGWTCTTPAVGAAGTVSCTNPSFATGSSVFTLVVRVGATTAPGTVITNTATVSSTTADPNVGNESATATTSVISPANVSGTKTVTGTFVPGSAVTYTIVLTNNGASTQQNNAGDEFVDVLPAALTLVSATATGGTAVATVGTNTVTWNGSIVAGGTVTITINATVRSDAAPGTVVNNQGTINYDADGNGTNESTRQTDSPAAGGASDPTSFTVIAPAILNAIPTLDEWALMALVALLATVAALALKR